MKKLLRAISFTGKVLVLIVLLFAGWIYLNATNLIKGKRAHADNIVPPDCPPSDPYCTGWGCPHAAYFDGKEFNIENDFLCGSPEYYLMERLMAQKFSQGEKRVDLLKFIHIPQKKNGALTLQLQENEAEESFIDWIKLWRVVHPKGSEVVVGSDFRSFHVLDKKDAAEKINMPQAAIHNGEKDLSGRWSNSTFLWNDPEKDDKTYRLNKDDRIEFSFTGLNPQKNALLLVKSSFRNWMMGDAPQPNHMISLGSFIHSYMGIRAGLALVALLSLVFGKKSLGLFPAFPVFFGVQGGKSIVFSYKDAAGAFRQFAINKPRAWRYNMEAIPVPKEAILPDGSLAIQTDFTKSHNLAFIGILQGATEPTHRTEELAITSATHSRIGNAAPLLSEKTGRQLHLIPGDKTDITFSDPEIPVSKDEQETYLLQSSGFYGALRPKYKKLAGAWMEKIPEEAKAHYERLLAKK